MNKIVSFMLIFLFVSSTFTTMFSTVSASELVEDSWTTKTSMSYARVSVGVVTVDSKIYVIGGTTGNSEVGTNERYDPATDTWVTLESMPTPRTGFAIIAYDNKIYCIGGGTNGSLSVNEVYDIASDSWSAKAPLPVSECFIWAHVVDGKIWVVTQQSLYVYDAIEDSWINKTNTPTQGVHAFSSVVDNKLIIIDQVVQASYREYNNVLFIVTMKVMIYNPQNGVWSEGQISPEFYGGDATSMMRPVVAGATTGVYAPKKIYILFGSSSYVYDPVVDIWSIIAGPSTSVIGYGVAVVDDLLYVFGGIHYPHVENMQYVPIGHKNAVSTPPPTPVTSNPTANFWSAKASMSQARFGLGVVAVDGKIYAIGGSTEAGLKNSLTGVNERYDPVTDTWTILEPMPTPRVNFAIVAYQDKIYCMGGSSFERGMQIECDVVEVYDIAANNWSARPFLPFNGRLQAYVIQEKIFIIKLSSYMENNLYMYNPVTYELIEKNSLPYIHNLVHISAVVDNKLIVMGSFMFNQLSADETDFELTSEQKTLVYNIETDSWSEKRTPPSTVGYVATGVTSGVYAPSKIYIPTVFGTYVYDPTSDTWTNAETMFIPRTGFGVAVVSDILYVIGGLTHTNTGSTSSSINEQYVPIDYIAASCSPESDIPKYTSIYITAVILIIIVGFVVAGLLFYLKNKKRA